MNRAEKRRQQKLAAKATGNAKPVQSPSPSTQQAIGLAVEHHNAGRLAEAEGVYRQILQTDPDQPDALHLLGMIAYQVGNHETAVELITRALAANPGYVDAHFNLGAVFIELRKLDEAVACYRKAIAIKPDYADAHCNLGNALQEMGKPDQAVASYLKALAIKPDFAEAYINLGSALHEQGKFDQAVEIYHKVLTTNPDHTEAHYNLGNALREMGRFDEAAASYGRALAINPDYAEAHYNLGNTLRELGKLNQAMDCYNKALIINPDYLDAHNNLGVLFKELGRLDNAEASYLRALAINPDYAGTYNNLGVLFKELGRLDEAVASYHKALSINPDYVEVYSNLGLALHELERLDEAVASYQKSLAINPDYAAAHSNLGLVLQDLGRLDEAVASYLKALDIKPDFAFSHSNMLLSEQYRSGHDARSLFELHCQWDEQHGKAFRADWPAHENVIDPERPLRIGFVSADLGRHPVGYFIILLLENLSAQEIETVCYSDRTGDDLTGRIKAATGNWRDIRGVSDDDLNGMIIDDKIDILFDLGGHTAKNRLLVFARKPAPLQVTWAGYVGTTGLEAMDYLLSDVHYTPDDERNHYREKIINMPDAYVCYDPPSYAPEVGPPPHQENGHVTFGSFNNPSKINAHVMALWADILESVPDSRLLLKYKGTDSDWNADRFTSFLTARGLDPDRLILEGRSAHEELLGRYNQIDIGLDTFPYSGGLTTCEALWMGVPVITLPGDTFAGRHSLSHLSTVGLPELAAGDADDYVKLAVGLAGDTARLANLRSDLRDMMATSPICDGKKFAEGFTVAMREIWRDGCLVKALAGRR